MKIDGTYTLPAPPALVWSLLHDPGTLEQLIPGCNHFRQRNDGQYFIILELPTGPMNGYYEGVVGLLEDREPETFRLSLTGSGPESVFSGQGTVTLEENGEETTLSYTGDVDVSGPIATQSPRLIRTTANYLIRNFFEALEQQVCQITGAPGVIGLPPADSEPLDRSKPTIGMQDFLAELRRDRWIAAIVIILGLLATFSTLGMVFVSLLAARWITRSITGRLAGAAASLPGDD